MKRPRGITKQDIKSYFVEVMGYSEYEDNYRWDELSQGQQEGCVNYCGLDN